MVDQKLQSSNQTLTGVPEKWQERFLIKRIDEQDIEITLSERDAILHALGNGQRFIQVGKYTLMLNGIKSIDPKWGVNNIPPRPKERYGGIEDPSVITIEKFGKPDNLEEVEEWDKYFNK